MIGNVPIIFLLDTGASVNTVTAESWWQIRTHAQSSVREWQPHPETTLRSYANSAVLDVECSFKAIICAGGTNRTMAKIFVVKGAEISLLSFNTAVSLGLVCIGPGKHYMLRNKTQETTVKDTFPKLNIGAVKFRIDKTVTPKQIIRYNIPKAFERAVNERLEEMELNGIIEYVDSEDAEISFVSPMVLVPKGNKDFRIVIDYREANKAIIRDPYPMPSLERIWTDIPNNDGKILFSKIDLKDAYFHIELHSEVRHLTAFMTMNGLMRFKRLPFGLSCAPEIFQKEMEKVFRNCKNVLIYLDDILMYGKSLKELKEIENMVREVIKKNGLTINEEKSCYGQEKVNFLGLTLDGEGILPMREKMTAIQNFDRPKDAGELRSFLGMLTFIGPFIRDFSHKTKPLRDLIKRDKFKWEEMHQNTFEELKKVAMEDLIKRGYFNEKDRIILYTDASPWGLGAILAQEKLSTSEMRIIACASKGLTETESRYPQLHREALAIVWAMERFAYYLLGRKFLLRSDSEALKFMIKPAKQKDIGKRIMSRAEGWFIRLDHYDFDFEHVPGNENIADTASRLCRSKEDYQFGVAKEPHELCLVTACVNQVNETLLALTTEEVGKELEKDVILNKVIAWLDKENEWPQEIARYKAFQRELYVENGFLFKQEKMVLPHILRNRALTLAHRSHPGMSTMKNVLRTGLWWPGMDKEIEAFVRSCPECQLVKTTNTAVPIELTELPENPWDYVSMDISSTTDNVKTLVLTDNYSRFLIAVPLERTDANSIQKALNRIFLTYYVPKKLKADNGPPFNAVDFKRWLADVWGIKLINSTPLNPTENGLVERGMQGINKIAAIARLEKKCWKQALAEYVADYNSWPHHVTKIAPAELMFGRAIRHRLPNPKTDTRQANDDELRDRDKMAKFQRNQREDTRRGARPLSIKPGDTVLVRNQKADKTDSSYKKELHEVLKICGAGRVTVKEKKSGKIYDRNVKHIKKFFMRKAEEGLTSGSSSSEEVAGLVKERQARLIKKPKRLIEY